MLLKFEIIKSLENFNLQLDILSYYFCLFFHNGNDAFLKKLGIPFKK